MKSLNFKRKDDSYLRYLEETNNKKVKTPFNWDRVIYLALLGVLIFFVLRYLLLSIFYIEGNGQVLFEKVDIRHTDDIRILEFLKSEGDDVAKGDTLFTYFSDEDMFGAGSGSGGGNSISISNSGKSNTWIDKEMYVLRKNIDLNTVRLEDYRSMRTVLNGSLERVENEVILDAVSHTNLENLGYRIDKLNTDISLLESQNSIYRKQLNKLDALKKEDDEIEKTNEISISQSTGNSLLAGVNDQQGFNYFTCPIEGNITKIDKQAFEVALKSENILSLHQPENVHIRGYFDQSDLSDLHEGDVVDIEFPDGTKSVGRIDRFEFSTRILPPEFQNKFEPTTRTLAIDVVPLVEKDLEIWRKYFKLSVKISKRTF